MKPLLFVCLALLAGCQAANKPEQTARTDDDRCGARSFAALVGEPGDAVDETQLPAGTRILRPGMVMTMDYRGERLNVIIGESGRVERVHCG